MYPDPGADFFYPAWICLLLPQVVVCKDGGGKVGMRVKAVNKGIFICLVTTDSPAALAGLRYLQQFFT